MPSSRRTDMSTSPSATPPQATDSRVVPTLANLRAGERGRVLAVAMPNADHGHDESLGLRLLEIGFVPGELVRVTALGPGGREPLAVQVGGTTFALRLHEAEHIRIERLA